MYGSITARPYTHNITNSVALHIIQHENRAAFLVLRLLGNLILNYIGSGNVYNKAVFVGGSASKRWHLAASYAISP